MVEFDDDVLGVPGTGKTGELIGIIDPGVPLLELAVFEIGVMSECEP